MAEREQPATAAGQRWDAGLHDGKHVFVACND
jgi:hypothetical protein